MRIQRVQQVRRIQYQIVWCTDGDFSGRNAQSFTTYVEADAESVYTEKVTAGFFVRFEYREVGPWILDEEYVLS